MNKITYALFYAVVWLFTLLPFRIIYLISDFLFVLLNYVFRYRKEVILNNLRNSFPEKSEKEIESIKREYYHHLCDFFFESVMSLHMTMKQLDKRYKLNNLELIEELYRKNKNIVMVSGHYANWEWLHHFHNKIKYKFITLYHVLEHKNFDKLMKKVRTRTGALLIPMNDAYRVILDYQRKNIPTITYFLADQSPPQDAQYWTTFLNQDTAYYLGAEKIAKKINASVVFIKTYKKGRGKYEATFELLFEDSKDVPQYKITDAHIKVLEDQIREVPNYWLWSHRRWKRKREVKSEK